ncbi:NAD-dependent epimerase/dehydratase [Sterolibacterium denitrificans]|uniref:NAD-dependent epimerase/dehydratase n=1 Tax=Sterolibacterium denitrificans TaxID=157592 RepID=A0A7Z7HNW0_9PROT|nr:NAD(P)H-binding protein [Sterolibacterium denitrificans]SMB21118.1 NAD-dependent epimerase/dehydratase [Sterolibacterium denitrificans]
MQKLLVIGCGDVALRALPLLARRYRVYALLRTADAQLREDLRLLGVTPLAGDLDRPASLRRLAGLADAVLHCAPPANQGLRDGRTRRLIAALRRGASLPRRLVYISTSGVYGDCAGAEVRETRRVQPATARARRRVDAEAELRRWGRVPGGPTVSILRAPGIYAAGRLPLERIQRGDPVLRAEDDVVTNHIHADDLAACAVAALRRGRAQRVYHASDDSSGLRMADWFDAVADAFVLPRPPRVSRAEAAQRLPALTLSFMNESRRLDNTRLKRELGVRLAWPDARAALAVISTQGTPSCSG